MRNNNIYPEKPGVYLFKSKDEVLYIGKAKNLKKRIDSYFLNKNDSKIKLLLKKFDKIDWIITTNEIEALILENNLIKKYKPKYNIKLVDSKTYPYIKIDFKETFPTIKVTRVKVKDKSLYFGPFPSAYTLKKTINFIFKYFKLRRCTKKKFSERNRPCLNYQIGQCLAPCCNLVSKEEYLKNLKNVIWFLKGKHNILINKLKSDMKQLSENLEYEKAAKIRDLIKEIEELFQKQIVELNSFIDKDVFYYEIKEDTLYLIILRIKNGKIVDSKFFAMKNYILELEENLLQKIIIEFYDNNKILPSKIVLPLKGLDENLIKKYFLKKFNKKIELEYLTNKVNNRLINLAKSNLETKILFEKEKSNILLKLKFELKLSKKPNRIDAFDISAFQGKAAVGSRVSFVNAKIEKSFYRRYAIKTVPKNKFDDYNMMYEVLKRSCKEYIETKQIPDLLLIDGGKGQLNIAYKVLKEYRLFDKIDFISIAKEKEKMFDKVYKVNRKNPLVIKEKSVLKFLMSIRDEVHRFSIAYHHKKDEIEKFSSQLLKIEGVGEKTAKKLFIYFGSLDNLKKANFSELIKLPFIKRNVAENIIKFLN